MLDLKLKQLAHLHVIVPDLDDASGFYREVMGFFEMQSHLGLVNRGLGTYYGFEEIWDRLNISLRFMFLPEVVTIKLVQIAVTGYGGRASLPSTSASIPGIYSNIGPGPISLVCEDLDQTYATLKGYASDYSSRYRIMLLSEPVFLSPLLPHQIGATPDSLLYGQDDALDDLKERWPLRAKFQMIDPFGVRWEFNNDVDGPGRGA